MVFSQALLLPALSAELLLLHLPVGRGQKLTRMGPSVAFLGPFMFLQMLELASGAVLAGPRTLVLRTRPLGSGPVWHRTSPADQTLWVASAVLSACGAQQESCRPDTRSVGHSSGGKKEPCQLAEALHRADPDVANHQVHQLSGIIYIYTHIYMYVCMSIYLPIHSSIHPSVYLTSTKTAQQPGIPQVTEWFPTFLVSLPKGAWAPSPQ